MKQLVFFCSLTFIGVSIFAQSKPVTTGTPGNQKPVQAAISAKITGKADTASTKHPAHNIMFLAEDTITMGDYMMSIQRVNENLNSIRDSANLSFEVVSLGQRLDELSEDIALIQQNVKGRNSVINIKNLYLYQSFATNLDKENSQIQAGLTRMYRRVYQAKLLLKTVLSDTIFRKLYADNSLRNTFDKKLVRLEKKWIKTDSITKSSIDSLNALKVQAAENSMTLSSILNTMERKLDRAVPKLFGPEVNCIWQKALNDDKSQNTQSLLASEQKAIGYYFSQTSNERYIVLVLGILLLIWMFYKRKLLKNLRQQKETYSFLPIQYLSRCPVLSLILLLLSLMPFFDAYAPTSYIAVEYSLLLLVSTVMFFKLRDRSFWYGWLVLVILFIAGILTYLLIIPTLAARIWLLALHASTIVFVLLFKRNLSEQMPYYKWIKWAAVLAIIFCGLGVICNLFGRFSLSGIFGIAGIFAITQAVVLPVVIDTVVEFVLLQVQSSRMKKGEGRPFDCSLVIQKIKKPLLIVALILWLIMLTSNLSIYHSISINVVDFLTTTRAIGSISYRWISVLLFFLIIWAAQILQRLVGFIFGETGIETEDTISASKSKHSRLLIPKLLILIGGYLLAIAASGLPLDKLTIIIGALGVGIGMGLQNMVNNFVSGIILIFDGSLKLGDEIEVNGQSGKVKEIGLRAVTLNTADGADVIIPNGPILSQNIVNWTLSNDQKRVVISFSVSGTELDANVINEVINNTVLSIPNVISQNRTVILYNKVTPGTCTMTARFWCTISTADRVKSEAMLKLSTAFAARNIVFE